MTAHIIIEYLKLHLPKDCILEDVCFGPSFRIHISNNLDLSIAITSQNYLCETLLIKDGEHYYNDELGYDDIVIIDSLQDLITEIGRISQLIK
jgi:hypothetical protein